MHLPPKKPITLAPLNDHFDITQLNCIKLILQIGKLKSNREAYEISTYVAHMMRSQILKANRAGANRTRSRTRTQRGKRAEGGTSFPCNNCAIYQTNTPGTGTLRGEIGDVLAGVPEEPKTGETKHSAAEIMEKYKWKWKSVYVFGKKKKIIIYMRLNAKGNTA